jgi:uncharacterized protein DUF3237
VSSSAEATTEAPVLELVPLCTMWADLRVPHVMQSTPSGDRQIYEVEGGAIEGERLRATVKGRSNADWLVIGPGGVGTLDVRALAETDDGALIFIQYNGRMHASSPMGPIYNAPRFETGDPRYDWLNRIQAVGKGRMEGMRLIYDVYEVR